MRIRTENLIASEEKQEPLTDLEKLEQLIPTYALNKSEFDSYKKLCEAENNEIKKLMSDLDITEKEVGNYVAKKTVSKRESINEDLLLNLFSSRWPTICKNLNIIKTREYVDYDALESAIYNGKIPPEMIADLNSARESKEVVTLKISKRKKEAK